MNDAGRASVVPKLDHSTRTRPSRLKGLVICSIAAAVLYVGWHGAVLGWEQQRRLTCAAVLQRFAAAARAYAQEVSPPTASSLTQNMIERKRIEPKSAACPSHPGVMSNYVLVAPNVNATDGRTIVAYEPKSNHGGDGGNIVFADGHSSFVLGEDYDRLIGALGAGKSAFEKP